MPRKTRKRIVEEFAERSEDHEQRLRDFHLTLLGFSLRRAWRKQTQAQAAEDQVFHNPSY